MNSPLTDDPEFHRLLDALASYIGFAAALKSIETVLDGMIFTEIVATNGGSIDGMQIPIEIQGEAARDAHARLLAYVLSKSGAQPWGPPRIS